MMVKEDWTVIQCPNCQKINKIPKKGTEQDNFEKIMKNVQFNTNVNHFDVDMPSVYVIVICPFCKTDNKVRNNAEHVVCYRCHNSVNIAKGKNGSYSMTANMGPGLGLDGGGPHTNSSTIPPKSIRFSDLFFPDPMFYPGYYPVNSYSPLYPQPFIPLSNIDPRSQRIEDYIQKRSRYELYKHNMRTERNRRFGKGDDYKSPLLKNDYNDKLMEKLKFIKEDIIDRDDRPNYSNKSMYGSSNRRSDMTPLKLTNKVDLDAIENTLIQLKDRIRNGKSDKNESVYKTIFGINK